MAKTTILRLLAMACCLLTVHAATHYLGANKTTVHWGYFWKNLKPKLTINSGDTVTVEMVTHHAGDDYEKMIKGDPGIESIYEWGASLSIPMRGATGTGDGVHVLTGPIYVRGAEKGDVLQIDILDLWPRPNPASGKTFGSNAAAWWGYQYRLPYKTGQQKREFATIYEVIKAPDGSILYAQPDYQFTYGNTPAYKGPLSPSCVPKSGVVPDSLAVNGTSPKWSFKEYVFAPGVPAPCVAGKQQWTGYQYPGIITKHPTGTEDYSIRGKFKVPVNLHIGNIGLVPDTNMAVNSIPPMKTGGNMDNRRIGKGATLYLPVENAGALLMMGDAHVAQGDSELDGTGIETSVNGKFKITLHKKANLPAFVKGLDFPLVENAGEWVVLGYAYKDYLAELKNPQSAIFSEGGSLDKAMTGAYKNARDWLMRFKGLTEDQAITLLTVAGDFAITQVVDGNWGVHVVIPKYVFSNPKAAFKPATKCGSSLPA